MNEIVLGFEHVAVSAILGVILGAYVIWKNNGGRDE